MKNETEFNDFICYLNDDGTEISGYVHVSEVTVSYVKFVTKDRNELIIPISRVKKIKRKV